MNHKNLLTIALTGGLLALAPTTQADVSYTVLDFGNIKGINTSGQTTGTYFTATGAYHAFATQNNVMHDLGTLGGTGTTFGGRNFDESISTDINASGEVTGYSYTVNREQHAFVTENGVMTDLGTLGGAYSRGYGINASGQVTGSSTTTVDERYAYSHAFVTQNGVMHDLGTLGGKGSSEGTDINDSGQVTGYSYTAMGGIHAFVTENGVMTNLGSLEGGDPSFGYSYGSGINASGQVTGTSGTSSGTYHAFVTKNDVMQDLGTLVSGPYSYSYGNGINASGQVIGYATIASVNAAMGAYHAFVTQNGVMTDLNTLIAANSGWTLTNATAINDNGQIIVEGINNEQNQYRTFVLAPISAVPVPAAVWLFGSALLGFIGLNRRKQATI